MTHLRKAANGYAGAILGVAAVPAVLAPFRDRIDNTTVALSLLLAVLVAAAQRGSGRGIAASALAVLCFNFFFLPPIYTFTVADPQNGIALAAFLIVATTAGELSARARRRVDEAHYHRDARGRNCIVLVKLRTRRIEAR